MNKNYSSASAIIAALGLSAATIIPANAADPYSRGSIKDSAPVAVELYTPTAWTGFWLAGVGGAAFNNDVLTYNWSEWCRENETSAKAEIDGLGSQGFFGEIQIGYDQQIGNLVIGLFGGLNVDTSEFEAGIDAGNNYSNIGGSISYSQEWGAVIGPRIGFASGNSLFYIAGGAAFGELSDIELKIHASAGGQSASDTARLQPEETDLFGLFAEVGMERKFESVQGLALRVAGRYTNYGSITLHSDGDGDDEHGWSEDLELDRDNLAVMLGLKYTIGAKK